MGRFLLPTKRTRADSGLARLGQVVAVGGFILYAAFAPHSIAAAEISLAIVGGGWLVRTLATGKMGFRRTQLDLPIWLFVLWTIASAVFSQEPRISMAKLQSVCVFFLFYLLNGGTETNGDIPRLHHDPFWRYGILIQHLRSLARAGRGRRVDFYQQSISRGKVQPGDTIWRVGEERIYSRDEIDRLIKASESGRRLTVSLITNGEHDERRGFVVTPELKSLASPSGISGSHRSHRFRASGWTRHYETFAEILQILAQLSLGLAFANFQNHGANRRCKLAGAAAVLLSIGIGLTAMRTALVALATGASVVAIRAARGHGRVVIVAAVGLVLGFGAVVVWQTRASNALMLDDASSSLRAQVARVGLSRIPTHPIFGHGMDAVKRHWSEWGFPGTTQIHLHSTPLQIAFDRGLPALIFWLWIMVASWQITQRAERLTRDLGDTNRHGVLLGAMGALAGFLASSLVNYNFGDGEVALVFWWLMGVVVVLARDNEPSVVREYSLT